MELVNPMLVNIIAVAAIIFGVAMAGWWVISLYSVSDRAEEEGLPHVSFPDDLREVRAGIPPTLILTYVFFAVALIVYLVYACLGGTTY